MQQPAPNAPITAAGGQATAPAVAATPTAAVDINTVRLRLNQLRTELNMAQEQQSEIIRNITRMPDAAQTGLQQQLSAVQQQIVSIQAQITATEAQIGTAVNTHATTTAPNDYNYPVRVVNHGTDPGAVLGVVFFVVVLGPLSWAFARRITRRGVPNTPIPPAFGEMPARFERLEQAVDTVALEIERISESQRFLTKLMAERQPASLPGASSAPNAGTSGSR